MRTKLLILFLFLIVTAADAQSAESQNADTFRIGLSTATFTKGNYNNDSVAIQSWFNAIAREQYERAEKLQKAFLQNKLEAAILSVEDIMMMKLKLQFVYIPTHAEGVTVRYAIIVRRDGGINTLNALTGRKLSTYENAGMVLARPWFESLLTASQRTTKFLDTDNPSKAIMQVFFHQSDAALVTMETFDLVCEMNPQLRNSLRTLSVSQPFIAGCFVFNPTFHGTLRERFENVLMELHTTQAGLQLLTVFQASRIERHPVSILADTIQFLEKEGRRKQKISAKGSQP
jgi:ABC-type phosphate/phosphonate transport system substrate-binding protein